jgi:hypothetical protein
MAETNTRTAEDMERMLTEYEQSGITKRQYCEQQGLPLSTFDYHWQRRRKKQQLAASEQQLVKVQLESEHSGFDAKKTANGFTLVLAKGRRIELDWHYSEQDLARLIRIVEAV